jgi:1-acyl-sn-glycerol-3-phosphate acyltransferase
MLSDYYFEERYQFVPPARNEFLARGISMLVPGRLRRVYHVPRWRIVGLDRLNDSLQQGVGILLTPNHVREADSSVVGLLSLESRRPFYLAASWHLFKKSRWLTWRLRHAGAFSVFREGVDRDAIREGIRILSSAERPLVIFPEGTWYRQNDRVGPLQEGAPFIARRAASSSSRPIVIHPVAIRYWALSDPRPLLNERVRRLEQSLQWWEGPGDFVSRLERVTLALLATKEVEYLGTTQSGSLDSRLHSLLENVLGEIEMRRLGKVSTGFALERLRTLRRRTAPVLAEARSESERREGWSDLRRLWHCHQMVAHDPQYLRELPSAERLVETVQRLEEDLVNMDARWIPLGAIVEVGEAIRVDASTTRHEGRGGGDPLSDAITGSLMAMLERSRIDGPPADWRGDWASDFPTVVRESMAATMPARLQT